MFGEANGTATGMAHHAHLAMYKVSEFECAEGYVLAAMDVVVEDGVDVLSLSVGCPTIPLYEDVIASCIWSNSKGSFSWLESVDNSTLPSPKPTFNIISGTSTLTLHLGGIAALLKKLHPDWSSNPPS
ncbi:hypothetical protein ACFXTH_032262 [Malus domestica]